MTADNLLHFLQQPEGLRRVSYEELKTLALEYPYCPHVHQLLLFKSRLAGHKDFYTDLTRTAARHVDRSALRRRIQELDAAATKARTPVQEEFFELMPPEELEKRLSGSWESQPAEVPYRPAPKAFTTPPAANLSPFSIKEIESLPGREEAAAEPEALEMPRAELAATGLPPVPSQEAMTASAAPEPMPKTAFRTWKRRHSPAPQLFVPAEPAVQEPASPDPRAAAQPYNLPDLRHLAELSVEENEEVASETLAALLVRQGHMAKAIEMYERLCLLFPGKSAYFAARIENLKK